MNTELQEWTVKSMLEWATGYFEEKGIPDPRHSIEWLLAETLDVKRLDLYLSFDRPLSPNELERLRPLVKRRARHEPLQYITGYSNFMNATLTVTPDVLIPRIETEQLVEIILDNHPTETSLSVLDIGTGSGCIPIALKMERPQWKISALDVSEDALEIARENADRNDVDITFLQADINNCDELSFSQSFDLIVSNPPYILPEEKETLEPQVKDHEPAGALFCESIDQTYKNILHCADRFLKKEGQLYVEINENYSSEILSLFNEFSWNTTLLKDYDGKPRFIKAGKPNSPAD